MTNKLKHISRSKGYQYLLLKLIVFFALLFIADLMVGGALKHLYFKQTSGWEYRTKYSVEDTRADVLIFGASRAQQQYNPTYFEERLHGSCYNVGRDGQSIFYHYAILRAVLKRYHPKTIILDVENGMFNKCQCSRDRINVLLPFYQDHREMRPVIEYKSPYEKWKLQSSIYPYNSLLFKLIHGNVKSGAEHEDINGYLPLNGKLDEPLRTVYMATANDIDPDKVNCYRWFIHDCMDANVQLFIVNSPVYMNAIGVDNSIAMAKQVAVQNHVRYIDLSKEKIFLNSPELFDDTVHVNVAGAIKFSNMVIDSIDSKK